MQQRARHCNCLSRNHGSDQKCEYTLLIVIFQKQEMSCQFYRHNQMKLMLNDVSETHKHLLKRVELLVHCKLMTVHTFQYRRLENGTLLHLSSIPLPFHVLQKHKKNTSHPSLLGICQSFSIPLSRNSEKINDLCLLYVRFISAIYMERCIQTRVHVIPLTQQTKHPVTFKCIEFRVGPPLHSE